MVGVHLGMDADTSFAWPAGEAVLDAPSGEDLDVTVVSAKRDRDLQDPFALEQPVADPRLDPEAITRGAQPTERLARDLLAGKKGLRVVAGVIGAEGEHGELSRACRTGQARHVLFRHIEGLTERSVPKNEVTGTD